MTAQAEATIKQLDTDAENLRPLYNGELQEYVRQRMAETGHRRKSVHFLQGSCGFRTVPTSVNITDTTDALKWARENAPELVKTTETLDTAAYRQHAASLFQATSTPCAICMIRSMI